MKHLERAMTYAAPVALLLLLTACGGDKGSGAAGASAAAASPSAAAPATESAPAAESAPPVDANPVDGKAFCAFLTEEEPKLKSIGSPVGAQAALTVDLAGWVEKHPEQKPRTASDLDDASQQSCPELRSSIVAAAGYSSFQKTFG
ncbi:hypothetical protein [Peterkaempfera bronchialis]|uniref:hypothetical protein n=1 Tax=Peterkaempfera bronchialis TaxID=2126346 RepID=UPI003C2B5886